MGGRSIHELDKQRRRLEVEKEELQSALEEAESALESEENKGLRAQLELGQVKQEVDRKISEKEEEFENTRKNQARAMDSMQASLECEQRAKAEALRIKKKLEGDINDLEISVDQANKANNEAQKLIKRYQGQFRDAEIACSEEAKARAELQGKANMSDRRGNALHGEMEEARALLDSAERGKRQTEAELVESRKAVSEMAAINSKASAEKRRIEGEVHTMHAEIDQTLIAAKNSEEKAKKQWWTQPALQMNYVLNRTTATARPRQRKHLNHKLWNWIQRLQMLRRMQSEVDVLSWQRWNPE